MQRYTFKKGELEYLKGFDNIIELDEYTKQFPQLKDGIEEFKNQYRINRLTNEWEDKHNV